MERSAERHVLRWRNSVWSALADLTKSVTRVKAVREKLSCCIEHMQQRSSAAPDAGDESRDAGAVNMRHQKRVVTVESCKPFPPSKVDQGEVVSRQPGRSGSHEQSDLSFCQGRGA